VERRAFLLTMTSSLLAVPPTAGAQPTTRTHRIGVLIAASKAFVTPYIQIFRQALRDLGYAEGRNIGIEYRYADGHYDRLPALAADLVNLHVDLIVTEGTPPTRAAIQATTTIPVVMTVTGDPVAAGLVRDLARPGGNLTGASFFLPELATKRLQLLKEAIPGIARVAVVWNSRNAVHGPAVQDMETTAKAIGVEIRHINIQAPDDVADALTVIAKGRDSLVILEDAMINVASTQIADTALKHRVPTIFGLSSFAEVGGLMAYGPNRVELWQRAAGFVDKILRGAKPGDLPVEQSVRFDMVINLKTAKALGLTIPPSLLARADRLIE
jgi:putative tryptophan/tyrosine transport system substrate-binding protein